MAISLKEAKKYLRVDHNDDDTLIQKFLNSGTTLVKDTLRVTDEEFEYNALIKETILYAVAYQYEHREDADMELMTKNIRYALSAERKAAF